MFLLSTGVYAAVNTKDMEDHVQQNRESSKEKQMDEVKVDSSQKLTNTDNVNSNTEMNNLISKNSEVAENEIDSNFVQIELKNQNVSTSESITINMDLECAPKNFNEDQSKKDDPINNFNSSKQVDYDAKSDQCSDVISLNEPSCRICQSGMEEEALISPCRCCGSVKWIHESCLVHWMKSSLKDSCELCRTKIDITRKRKSLLKWKLPSQRPTPVLWVLVFITAIALNLASVIKDASRLCTSTPCLVFYAVGCVGVILGTLFLIYWSKRARIFIGHWIEQNEEWVVIISEDQQKIGDTKKDIPSTKQADGMINRSIIQIV